MLKTYYQLTKPGIIYGNAITAIAGFFLASRSNISFLLLFQTLIGISLVIASSCVLNNIFDREIDKKMQRTKNRALAKGSVLIKNAFAYAIILGTIGFSTLIIFTNLLSTFVALTGFIFYVFIYTPIKHRSVYATLIGSISGAVPPVVGYTAVTNNLDLGALILFLILVFWQMPHFYSIAIFRINEYSQANIPVLSVKNGINVTKIHILFYIIAFILASSLLTLFGYTGYFYLLIVTLIGIIWLGLFVKGSKTSNEKVWAHKMFRFSLWVLLATSIMISLDVV